MESGSKDDIDSGWCRSERDISDSDRATEEDVIEILFPYFLLDSNPLPFLNFLT